MTSTTRISKAEITGIYGAMVKKFSKKMLGEVPERLGVMWHNRRIARAKPFRSVKNLPPTTGS